MCNFQMKQSRSQEVLSKREPCETLSTACSEQEYDSQTIPMSDVPMSIVTGFEPSNSSCASTVSTPSTPMAETEHGAQPGTALRTIANQIQVQASDDSPVSGEMEDDAVADGHMFYASRNHVNSDRAIAQAHNMTLQDSQNFVPGGLFGDRTSLGSSHVLKRDPAICSTAPSPILYLDGLGNLESQRLPINLGGGVVTTTLNSLSRGNSSFVRRTSSSLDDEDDQSRKRSKSNENSSSSILLHPLLVCTTRSPMSINHQGTVPLQPTTAAVCNRMEQVAVREHENAVMSAAISTQTVGRKESGDYFLICDLTRSGASSLPKSIAMLAKDETLKIFVQNLGSEGLFDISYNRFIIYEARFDAATDTIYILRVRSVESTQTGGGSDLKLELNSANAGQVQENGVQALHANDTVVYDLHYTQSLLIRPLWSGHNFKSGYSNHILVSFQLQHQTFVAQVRLKSGPDDLFQKRSTLSYPFRIGNLIFRLTLTCRKLRDERNLAAAAAVLEPPIRCAERSQQMSKSKKNKNKHVFGLIAAYSRLDDVECFAYDLRLESSAAISRFQTRAVQTKDSTVNNETEEFCIVCQPSR